MKTLLIMLVSIALSSVVFAQPKIYYHPYHPYYSRVYISPFAYGPVFGYPYFGSPYYGNRMPYKLALEIQSIKTDYKNKIREARKDKSLSHPQRRLEIRSLKAERDQEIINAQRNFSRHPKMNNQNPDNRHSSSENPYIP